MAAVKADRLLQVGILLSLAALVWVVTGAFREPHIVAAGDEAPDFRVRTEDGRTLTRSNFGGKLLVLHFWATWCPPCVTETPSLNAFQKELSRDGVVVLGVSVDTDEKAYRAFLKRMNISFATARDPESKISYDYGTFQYPETYIINREGKVVEKIISNAEWMDPERIAVIKKALSAS